MWLNLLMSDFHFALLCLVERFVIWQPAFRIRNRFVPVTFVCVSLGFSSSLVASLLYPCIMIPFVTEFVVLMICYAVG